MEKNIISKTLSFIKGMTNIPSDFLCEDGELLESVGFIYKDGEMKPIQKPVKIGNVAEKIMYVHKMADFENIIAYDNDRVYAYRRDNGSIGGFINSFYVGKVSDINSVGNTLIVATDSGLHYILYKNNTYHDLGQYMPTPKVQFTTDANNTRLGGDTVCDLREICKAEDYWAYYNSDGSIKGMGITASDGAAYSSNCCKHTVIDNDSEKNKAFQDAVRGHIASRLQKAKEKNYFCFPFFVRYALRLFDGSYARISAPILVCPTINRNNYFTPVYYDKCRVDFIEDAERNTLYYEYKPYYSKLFYKASVEGMENWQDIVKEIVVFASDEVMPFDIDGEYEFRSPSSTDGLCYANQVSGKPSSTGTVFPGFDNPSLEINLNGYYNFNYNTYKAREVILPKEFKQDTNIIKELLTKTQYYKLFSLEISETNLNQIYYDEAPINAHVVQNLEVQEQLGVDDYYGWTRISSSHLYQYNRRCNLLGIKRMPFSGFSDFVSVTIIGAKVDITGSDDLADYDIYTHIVSDTMSTWVKSKVTYTALPEMLRSWIFYPDPNATEMRIVKSGTNKGISIKLKVHPMLNGAYYFNKLPFPRISQDSFAYEDVDIPVIDEQAHETINSQIFTSVVNNPFVFEASGDNTVGTGKIIGIVANTEAVSQGQFGSYPLIVFTTEGMYGLSVNSEGLYSSSNPLPREVCNENSPLVPTDSFVAFASAKGLMAASGGSAACLSPQLRGATAKNADVFGLIGDDGLINFMKDCLIAYDYRDSLLRIYSKGKQYSYVYNIIDKTFSMVYNGVEIESVINDYPDNLIQDTYGNIYSLVSKPDINDDQNLYDGTIVTRPLKLGGSRVLKSFRFLKNFYSAEGPCIKTYIYGSNDCNHWCQLQSLGGKPWKFFVIKYVLTGFKATDHFSGSLVEVQSRREANK